MNDRKDAEAAGPPPGNSTGRIALLWPSVHEPTRRRLLIVALLTLGVRAVYALGWLGLSGEGLSGEGLTAYTAHGDGYSYLNYARFVAGDVSELSAYDRRVFPGLPMLLAAVRLLGVPVEIAGLLVAVAAGVAANVLAAVLFRDWRVGLLMAVCPPIYVACGPMVGNETPMLALLTGGLVLAVRGGCWRVAAAGLLLGAAGAVRPMAAFGVLGLTAYLATHRRWADALTSGAIAAAVVGLALAAVAAWFDDPLEGVKEYQRSERAYAGSIFDWPLASILRTPGAEGVPLVKVVYVWGYLLAAVACVGVLVWRTIRPRDAGRPMLLLASVWAGLNLAFALCVGDKWGFHIFPRLLLPALPAMLWALVLLAPPLRPRTLIGLVALLAAVCLPVALFEGRPQ